MSWPSIGDFTAAIQNPAICFDDPDLKAGQVELNSGRRPLVYSGAFAAVYPVSVGDSKFAVRCFTREVIDQKERYEHLTDYLRGIMPPGFVRFKFLERGILVQGKWYPIVRMDWVDGEPLSKYVDSNRKNSGALRDVAASWLGVAGALQGKNIAHNDLQHGNVMVQSDASIRLVDYDGIFLPHNKGKRSPETGHHNFQHPSRTADDYDEHIDNFPAIVIYLSLLALAADPGLWQDFHNADNLIFTKADYADPANSECFRALKNSPSSTVKNLAHYLEKCCARPLERIPYLDSILEPNAILCSQCYEANPSDLIYCDEEECYATLKSGNRDCAHCGIGGPVNASYCHDCGIKVA